jgi:hypothetical protein
MISLHLLACQHTATLVIETTDREQYRLTYCPERCGTAMKATTKTILFGRVTHERKLHQWPIAAFANADAAKSYATFLKLTCRSKDAVALLALDPQHPKDVNDVPLFDAKWSIVTVPYDPAPDIAEDDSAVTDETPTT